MSLIQDALKRQQEEMNKKAGAESPPATPAAEQPPSLMAKMPLRMMNQPSFAPPPTSAATPAPVPVTGAPAAAPTPPPLASAKESKASAHPEKAPAEEPSKADASPVVTAYDESRRPKALVPVLIAAILLFAVGFYYGWPLVQNALKKSPPDSAATISAPQPDSGQVAVTPQTGATVQATVVSTTGSAAASNAVAKTTPSNPTQPVNPAAPADTNGVAPPAESNDYPVANIAKPTLDLKPPPKLFVQAPKTIAIEPVVWPPLKFTGCINMGTSALAIINGQMVEPGQKIEDVLLVTVSRNEAVIRLEGEERTLRVGETAR